MAPNRQRSNRELRLYFGRAAENVPELVRALDGAGIRLQGLTIEQPSLDDVFLRVTGEALEHEVDEAAPEDVARPRAEVRVMNDILLLIGRSLRNTLREPATILPNIAISVFFLFVYNSGLSSVAELPGFQGTYLGFILPVAIVSAAVGGAGLAGQTLIKDIDNGYFTKLLLTPTRRLVGDLGTDDRERDRPHGPGRARHADRPGPGAQGRDGTGWASPLVVVLAFLWGMAFAGYAAFMALKTKNAAAAQAATFAFFPLIFLSYTFVPKEYVTAGWLKVAATINPTTYVFDSMRSLLNTGWDGTSLLVGFAVTFGFATVTGIMALWAARGATKIVPTERSAAAARRGAAPLGL